MTRLITVKRCAAGLALGIAVAAAMLALSGHAGHAQQALTDAAHAASYCQEAAQDAVHVYRTFIGR